MDDVERSFSRPVSSLERQTGPRGGSLLEHKIGGAFVRLPGLLGRDDKRGQHVQRTS